MLRSDIRSNGPYMVLAQALTGTSPPVSEQPMPEATKIHLHQQYPSYPEHAVRFYHDKGMSLTLTQLRLDIPQ